MKDFIPDSHANRLAWLVNLKTELLKITAKLGWNATKIASVTALLDPLIAVYQTLVDLEKAAAQASVTADQTFNTNNADLRDLINEVKNNDGYEPGMGVLLRILSASTQRDPASIQPEIDAEVLPGRVRITGTKDYAELYNLYMRIVGSAGWILIGIRRKKFPFDDETPLKTPGVFEEREYYAHGVINDEEVGHPSAIIAVKFPG
jgi:hypothetical protein